MKSSQALCSLNKKRIKKEILDIVDVVSDAKYICRKCVRASRDKQHLCKPMKMKLRRIKKGSKAS